MPEVIIHKFGDQTFISKRYTTKDLKPLSYKSKQLLLKSIEELKVREQQLPSTLVLSKEQKQNGFS